MTIVTEKPFCSSFKVFRINNIDADVYDFGESYDDEPYNAPAYGCGNRQFHPYEEPSEEVLNKYNINYTEWFEVCDKLKSELDWGGCAYCA